MNSFNGSFVCEKCDQEIEELDITPEKINDFVYLCDRCHSEEEKNELLKLAGDSQEESIYDNSI